MASVELGFIPPAKLMDNKFIVITKSSGSPKENLTQVETIEEAIKTIQSYLYEQNLDNSLTFESKLDNWKFCFPVFLNEDGGIDYTKLYAGFSAKSGHEIYLINDNGMEKVKITDNLQKSMRFLIGVENVKAGKNIIPIPSVKDGIWFAMDARQSRYLNKFDDVDLSDKTIISIWKISSEKTISEVKI